MYDFTTRHDLDCITKHGGKTIIKDFLLFPGRLALPSRSVQSIKKFYGGGRLDVMHLAVCVVGLLSPSKMVSSTTFALELQMHIWSISMLPSFRMNSVT